MGKNDVTMALCAQGKKTLGAGKVGCRDGPRALRGRGAMDGRYDAWGTSHDMCGCSQTRRTGE